MHVTQERENLSTVVAPHLPYLRRYARALAGDQAAGDGYVAQTLEALIADRDAMDHDIAPRVALYRLFTRIWAAAAGAADAPMEGPATPRSRQLLLLVTVEDFTPGDAAQVMEIEAEEAALLGKAAAGDLAALSRARILIIEDEPIIALDIENIVSEMGHAVVGVADTHREAVDKAAETTPDLILADIQLADGSSGVEAVEEIQTSSDVPVIFITAYPERLLTGDRVEPLFLITKPFRPEAVEAAIAQALFHKKTWATPL